MLLLQDSALGERRRIASGPLHPLAESLARDLDPLIARGVYIPKQKALLSRAGGRCPRDGTMLAFDPFSPDDHTCPACGVVYRGELHHRWWIYWYQLWLAERATHASLLFLLLRDPRHATLASDILRGYADAYLTYPNADNVLGPTRLFFSTYLESIWLLQICAAADFMQAAGDAALAADVRDRIIEPSAALIAEYDEHLSNRQVWNNAALMASALSLGRHADAERIVHARSGVEAHLRHGLLDDGTWYEGENYHLFAHRGLWYGVTLAQQAGIDIDQRLVARFQEGFATPFATALPDFTFPSRKDSQYAISLHQWRFAESCEVGLARGDDERLTAALAKLYDPAIAPRDTGRARSSAEAERNMPAARLTRADLGWRSLLHARASLPALARATQRSAHLPGQGVTVFRRDGGETYVALDWGQSGGGHGHPDRLNVIFAQGATRWLDDLGTGSYVDPSLHWYRSTLAHNAPLVDGHSQARVPGHLLAHDERGGVGWVLARVDGIAPGVRVERAIVVTPDYFVDELTWTAESEVRFDLPVHFAAESVGLEWSAAPLDGGTGTEDGFAFARDAARASLGAMQVAALNAEHDGRTMQTWICSSTDADLFRATGPGQPADARRAFHVVRTHGTRGTIRIVWAWSQRVERVTFAGDKTAVALGGEHHLHFRTPDYWQMELNVGEAKSGIELYGWTRAPQPEQRAPSVQRTPAPIDVGAAPHPARWTLGGDHYRRSELAWRDAGAPTANVAMHVDGIDLVIDAEIATSAPVFIAADATNPYDNENADINGHGVQLYVRTTAASGSWILVPQDGGTTVRVHAIDLSELTLHGAAWARTADGFAVRARVALPEAVASGTETFVANVLVNDAAPGRERRRGQLILSGADPDDFIYLQGDRLDPTRMVLLRANP